MFTHLFMYTFLDERVGRKRF